MCELSSLHLFIVCISILDINQLNIDFVGSPGKSKESGDRGIKPATFPRPLSQCFPRGASLLGGHAELEVPGVSERWDTAGHSHTVA